MHEGHRERLRKRFIENGLQGFEKHNMLELLLFYAIPRRDTNELAHRLINSFGSLSGVFNASFEELCRVEGIGENAAALIKLIPELSREYIADCGSAGTVITGADDACNYAGKQFIGATAEKLIMLCLNSAGKLINTETVADGSVTYVNVNMRRIVELAVKNNAVSVILAHNHPSGNIHPSGDDAMVTLMVRDALKMIDVALADHIICSSVGEAFSMASCADFKNYF